MTSAAEAAPSHPLHGRIDMAELRLEWAEAPWDTAVFGHPVVQVSRIEARTGASAADLAPFVAACEVGGVGLASCRLPHDRLRESMLLEEVGFRFIEMVFQPEFGDLQSAGPRDAQGLVVERARPEDLEEIVEVAGGAFRNERFHVDPRLPSRLGDLRYQNWVRSSSSIPRNASMPCAKGPNWSPSSSPSSLPTAPATGISTRSCRSGRAGATACAPGAR